MRIRRVLSVLLCIALAALCGPALSGEAPAGPAVDDCGLRGYETSRGWQYVILGSYPYEADGTEYPVLWQVLAVEDGSALLYTTYIIDAHQAMEVEGSDAKNKNYPNLSTYAETDLNRWLNEVMIEKLLGSDPVLPAVQTEGDIGRLYPLTDHQLMTEAYGFTDQRFYEVKSRWAFATPYALEKDDFVNNRLKKDGKYGTSSYWAANLKRHPITQEEQLGKRMQVCAGYTDSHKEGDTNIGHLSNEYLHSSVGLRLAVRLDTSKIQVVSGSGTIWDPCRLAYVEDKSAEPPVAVTPVPVSGPTPVPMTPVPVRNRPTLAPPEAGATPVPVPEWINGGAE